MPVLAVIDQGAVVVFHHGALIVTQTTSTPSAGAGAITALGVQQLAQRVRRDRLPVMRAGQLADRVPNGFGDVIARCLCRQLRHLRRLHRRHAAHRHTAHR
ncbi:hypothetical protein H7I87_02755 [Mycobacterium timonense]|uniref:Uncharacterized protein n=1 Tax=Mycobacterium bouchedurhonense TaxID=701041 RepID=A0AAW5SBF4_MYCBC|nr:MULTISPECIES: hypothetical protein [Mycobacterium avium complex (MAC)]MCV6991828.1 hypothetical protein [Mycobacterium bouchedurhonense]MCV6993649.1 hypothetical protein [Mycobacterium timonense]ORA45770.1 hypothetical protein BST19_19935 [Mycobacterium bouchedurhonense]